MHTQNLNMCVFFDYFEIMSIIKIRYIEEYCVFDILRSRYIDGYSKSS